MSDRDRNDDGRGAAKSPPAEPEIFPPERSGGRSGVVWVSMDRHSGTRRVYVARPGPFTIILALAILALIAVVMLIALLSVALIWIPVVMLLVLAFATTMYWRRFRTWITRR
jgi:hypothetical protein